MLDLTPVFLQERFSDGGPLFCRTDTHWSGRACALAAHLIAEEIRNRPWMKSIPRRNYQVQTRTVEIVGDLWRALDDPDLPKEQLLLTWVREQKAGTPAPVVPWRQSPVLLLGDSHNLVFQAGDDMHARGAGLADHLAHQLGFPVDLVAVRGSGATPSRLNLFRRRDNLQGKKFIIWCLSVREFTEGQGWGKVPVIRGLSR